MKENILLTKSYTFALRMVKLYQHLSQEKKEFVLSKQTLRAGTSIGEPMSKRQTRPNPKRILFINYQSQTKKLLKRITAALER